MGDTLKKAVTAVGSVLLVPVILAVIITLTLLVLMFSAYILTFFGVMLLMFVLLWAVGVKIDITENDVNIGYIRWFTFYPTPQQHESQLKLTVKGRNKQ